MPEVETIRRGLEKYTTGQKIVAAEFFDAKFKFDDTAIVGARILGYRRFGKLMVMDLDNKKSILLHLRMTGQLVYRHSDDMADDNADVAKFNGDQHGAGEQDFGGGHPTDSLVGLLPDKSTRVCFTLEHGALYFNDQRKFGIVEVLSTDEVLNTPFIRQLGPEPPSNVDEFLKRARKHQKSVIKATILDQHVVAGIGNIYADESLFAAKIHPASPTGALDDSQLKSIYHAAADVMDLSISLGGSTARNYVSADGRRGAYLDFANVFRRESKPCAVCQTTIKKIRVAGRGTHFCPNCQEMFN